MSLRAPTDNENAWERFLASARNDHACHLEPFGALRINSVRDLSLILFSKATKLDKGATRARTISREGAERRVVISNPLANLGVTPEKIFLNPSHWLGFAVAWRSCVSARGNLFAQPAGTNVLRPQREARENSVPCLSIVGQACWAKRTSSRICITLFTTHLGIFIAIGQP